MARYNFATKLFDGRSNSINKAVMDKLRSKQDSLARKGPNLLRSSLAEVLMGTPLAKHAETVLRLPTESRNESNPKIGSGVMMKLTGGRLAVRVRITPRAFGGGQEGKDAYYALMVAQYGRKAIRPTKSKVLALAVSSVDARRKGKARPHHSRPGKFVVFTNYAGPVAPYHLWIDKAQNRAVRKFIELAEKA